MDDRRPCLEVMGILKKKPGAPSFSENAQSPETSPIVLRRLRAAWLRRMQAVGQCADAPAFFERYLALLSAASGPAAMASATDPGWEVWFQRATGAAEDVRRALIRSVAAYAGRPEVRPFLLERLQAATEPDWSLRVAAAEALAGCADGEARAALLRALNDECPAVQCAAAAALTAHVRDAKVQSALLVCATAAAPALRAAALTALSGCCGRAAVRAACLEALVDPLESVRLAAAYTLRSVAGRPDVASQLREHLFHPFWGTRAAAATALAAAADRERLRCLFILKDAAWAVRLAGVALTSGLLDAPPVRTLLLERFYDDSAEVRVVAVRAAAAVAPAPEVRVALLSRLLDASCNVRRAAVLSLREVIGEEPTRAAVGGRLNDASPDVRRAAFDVLAAEARRNGRGAWVTTYLSDGRWDIREAAAHAAAPLANDRTVRQQLLELLDDAYWDVRLAAAQSLTAEAWRSEVQNALWRLLSQSPTSACPTTTTGVILRILAPRLPSETLTRLSAGDWLRRLSRRQAFELFRGLEALVAAEDDPTRTGLAVLSVVRVCPVSLDQVLDLSTFPMVRRFMRPAAWFSPSAHSSRTLFFCSPCPTVEVMRH